VTSPPPVPEICIEPIIEIPEKTIPIQKKTPTFIINILRIFGRK
jgi:hypothetical protein